MAGLRFRVYVLTYFQPGSPSDERVEQDLAAFEQREQALEWAREAASKEVHDAPEMADIICVYDRIDEREIFRQRRPTSSAAWY